MKRKMCVSILLAAVLLLSACSSSSGFDITGMWESGSGTIISFGDNGVCSPTLFGFDGGPNGSYSISEKKDEDGYYTLQASHLTGGNIVYKVNVIDNDEIELDAVGESYFGSSHYNLKRQ
jgi:major membrane immunogen (membrane-anchored lipoprotein)